MLRLERESVIELLTDLNISVYNDIWELQEKVREKNLSGIKFADGASKICIIFENKPFVIKWASGDDNDDEAVAEAEIYQKAVEAHLEKFFPKTAVLCKINGITFVAQERIDRSVQEGVSSRIEKDRIEKITKTVSEKVVKKAQKDMNKASRIHGYSRDISITWLKMIISLFGKKTCKELCNFVTENGINDLHRNNIGFLHGVPIILDFSGYHRG